MTKGLTSRKPFEGPRSLQVASPLGEQGSYKSQALWGTKAIAHVPRSLMVASPLGTKGLTSRKPFRGQSRLHKSQALWVVKGLTSRKPFGDHGDNKSQALWGPWG